MRLLVTGKGSYVGGHIKSWLKKNGEYIVEELDVQKEAYKEFDYSGFDCVIHVAAIVHMAKQNIPWGTYFRVNALLPYQIAKRAKESNVRHFIFISTMAVYGQGKKLPNGNVITEGTLPEPDDYYGKSKLLGEEMIQSLADESFCISIIRPPNIYGKNCPGNYFNAFVKMVNILRIFPEVYEKSCQSFLYIDNLSELVRKIIIYRSEGVFLPQDSYPISTNELLSNIAKACNKKIYFSGILGRIVRLFSWAGIVKKVYGGVSYESELSESFHGEYRVVDTVEGIARSIAKGKQVITEDI